MKHKHLIIYILLGGIILLFIYCFTAEIKVKLRKVAAVCLTVGEYHSTGLRTFSLNYGKSLAIFGGSHSIAQESLPLKVYWKEQLNLKITDYGVGGAGYSSLTAGGTNDVQSQVRRATSEEAQAFDIYLLWCSTNDYSMNVEVGSITDSLTTTQNGGLNNCIKMIYHKNPKAKIIMFTSLKIPYDDYDGCASDGKLANYVRGQQAVAQYYGIPCVNLFDAIQFNQYNCDQYITSDKVHLTVPGYMLFADLTCSALANL